MEILDYGYCKLTVVPVRSSESDSSEIVTQLLFGDLVEIIEKGKPWIKIRFPQENYEGWMDFKQLTYLNKSEYAQLQNEPVTYLKDAMAFITGPTGVQTLFLGSALRNLDGNKMRFVDETYTFLQSPNQENKSLIEKAKVYLNAPYLWGGKSLFGIDCSGLVQNCLKAEGIIVPRDASQQVNSGVSVDFEDRQAGDIPFFINAKGIVHHVGILVSQDEIIHAAGQVRIDPFDDRGIFRKDFDNYTHQYHSIRRIR